MRSMLKTTSPYSNDHAAAPGLPDDPSAPVNFELLDVRILSLVVRKHQRTQQRALVLLVTANAPQATFEHHHR